jgi:hypothetical protein
MPAGEDPKRLHYGPNKYAAYHLLLCRWLRHHARQTNYRYITLGGTELGDVFSIRFIDENLLGKPISFEIDPERRELVQATADALETLGLKVEIIDGDFFRELRCERTEEPHLIFVDLEGVCAFSDYHETFGKLFQQEQIREGDCLIITSFLARVSWERVFETYDGEFRVLEVSSASAKQCLYKRSHPSFTLYRALRHVDLQDTLSLRCFGTIEYKDSSPMAVYGYVIEEGTTQLKDVVLNVPMHQIAYKRTRG